MKAIDIVRAMNRLAPELPADTVDRVIYGDPEREVRRMAVCFMPFRATIEKAKTLGADVLVAHEPTFFAHRDLDDPKYSKLPAVKEKMTLIEELDITIVRCHDVWDWHFREEGTFASLARFLGLAVPDVAKWDHICDAPEQTALEFAESVARKTAALGQRVVQFYGDPDRRIRRVSVWGDPIEMFERGADLAFDYDDCPTVTAWICGEWCRDTGNPLVVVNHGVLEAPGIASLARYLRRTFPEIDVVHIEQGCIYREVF